MITDVIKIQMDLICENGLHVGNREGGNPPRGLNAPILQNPALQIIKSNKKQFAPYIPATAIKGKLRNIAEMLFEKEFNRQFHSMENEETHTKIRLQRHECDNPKSAKNCSVCSLFGSSSRSATALETEENRSIPEYNENFEGRLKFRNAVLKNAQMFNQAAELKTENAISRWTKQANPRTNERTPRTTEFSFEMQYFVYHDELDRTNARLFNLAACLRFLEDYYVGGNGSRGYGKIKILNLTVANRKFDSILDWQRTLKSNTEEQ